MTGHRCAGRLLLHTGKSGRVAYRLTKCGRFHVVEVAMTMHGEPYWGDAHHFIREGDALRFARHLRPGIAGALAKRAPQLTRLMPR